MPEILAVARVFYNIARNSVGILARNAGSYEVKTCLLRFKNGIVNLFLLVAHLAYGHGSCHIAVVAVVKCAVVHGDKVADFDFLIRRNAVRHRRIFTAYGDSLERKTLGAVRQHIVFESERNLLFGNAGLYKAAYVVECSLGDFLCLFYLFDFGLGFYHTESVNHIVKLARKIYAYVFKRIIEFRKLGHSHTRRLNADLFGTV